MTGSPRLSDVVLREAVREAVAASSLRPVSEQIGMSHNGLSNFLKGKNLQRKTREKLTRWYFARFEVSQGVPVEEYESAMAVVISYLQDQAKSKAVRERQIREAIERIRETK